MYLYVGYNLEQHLLPPFESKKKWWFIDTKMYDWKLSRQTLDLTHLPDLETIIARAADPAEDRVYANHIFISRSPAIASVRPLPVSPANPEARTGPGCCNVLLLAIIDRSFDRVERPPAGEPPPPIIHRLDGHEPR